LIEPYAKPDRKALRQFGLLFGAFLVALFGVLFPWLAGHLWQRWWAWYAGGAIAALALAWPGALYPLHRGWMAFGAVAGWVNTRLILLLLFYAVILPVGLAMRLFGADPMGRRAPRNADSYRQAGASRDRQHVEKPY